MIRANSRHAWFDRREERNKSSIADALVGASTADFEAILSAAATVRARRWGTIVTYSRKVFLPLTNLCRDRCGYCAFRKEPGNSRAWTMSASEIAQWTDRAVASDCKEVLISLGDRPEIRYPGYARWLRDQGYASTLDFVIATSRYVLGAGLLPHTNAGVLSRDELAALKPWNASLGLMLENVSPRMMERGMPHHGSPDKRPAVRLQMLADAGTLRIPFTTGVLVGIGETRAELIESLVAIQRIHERFGHIQEVIIQGFRAKPKTRMRDFPDAADETVAFAVAAARLILDDQISVQSPPNLGINAIELLLRAGINDLGGISPASPDYINPEAAWPHIGTLADRCAAVGFTLRERLAVYPAFIGRPGFVSETVGPRVQDLMARIA